MQGEKDLTSAQLNEANPLPGAANTVSCGATKLMPFWDPLRGDPRFEKIVASLAPKQVCRGSRVGCPPEFEGDTPATTGRKSSPPLSRKTIKLQPARRGEDHTDIADEETVHEQLENHWAAMMCLTS